MATCEMCGGPARNAKIAYIEGSRLTVCEKCAGHGNVVAEYGGERKVYSKKPIYRKEEKTFDIVDNYDALIRNERQKRDWKQEELALKINEPASLVERIENGKAAPSEAVAKKLERLFGIKLIEEIENTAVELPREKSSGVTLGDVVKIRKRR